MTINVVITGGTKGIGRGISSLLLKESCKVITCARSLPEPGLFSEYGDNFVFIRCDISKSEDRSSFLDEIFGRFDKIDVLINNAGISPPERFDILETTEESFDLVMSVNLKGPFFLTQAIAKHMVEKITDDGLNGNITGDDAGRPPGFDGIPCIINISSISSYTSSINRAEYCISKAGISMMTKLYAHKLAEYGISVYEIRPGIIETSMTEKVHNKYDRLIGEGLLPIARWGKPEDIAKVCLAIIKGYLPYSTGDVINIDGGFHLRRL